MTKTAPKILGILNITSDSFSDGGKFLEPAAALAHAKHLIASGADILDIGAAASSPDSQTVPAEIEIARLASVLPDLKKMGGVALSIDSYCTKTQNWALAQGVDWLNDIHGFADAALYERLADSACRLCVMHAIQSAGAATRVPPPAGDILAHVLRFFDRRLNLLEKAGIARARIVLDPGMGFFLGNQPAPSLHMLAHIDRLKAAFGLPVMVSVSRKSFLQTMSEQPIENNAAMTLAAELWAAEQGVDYIRTHDVAQLRNALNLCLKSAP
ncbi:MAG: dihydropteroate synthase [Alphaproteobacteria bacterium]|nr:dihydropteroate synthase [Alphaproteobacteria bacterium]